MHIENARHYWIDAAGQDNRAAVIAGLPVPPPLLPAVSPRSKMERPSSQISSRSGPSSPKP